MLPSLTIRCMSGGPKATLFVHWALLTSRGQGLHERRVWKVLYNTILPVRCCFPLLPGSMGSQAL
jgi:hypothetical protein